MFDAWLEKGDALYSYGFESLAIVDALGPVATFNFTGLAAAWWNGLLQDLCTEYSKNQPTLCHIVHTSIMSVKFKHLCYWQ